MASISEVRQIFVLIFGEDFQELVIEIIFLIKTDGLDLVKLGNDPLLVITTAGTLAHMVRQLVEARALSSEIPALRKIAECRDKSFNKDATDDDVVGFSEKAYKRNASVRYRPAHCQPQPPRCPFVSV